MNKVVMRIGVLGMALLLLFSCKKENVLPHTKIVVDPAISIEEIQFVNDSVGYLVGGVKFDYGVVYKTVDKGETWELITQVSERLNSLHVFDENNAYFVGDRREGDTLNIIHLTNGVVEDKSYYDQWSVSDLQSITFIDSLRGFMVSEDHQGIGYVLRTINGGKLWKYERDIYNGFVDVAVYDENSIVAGAFGTIKKVSADGITITPLDVDSDIFYDVDYMSESQIIACGYNGNVYRSNDKGETWEKIFNKKLFQNYHFNNLNFINPDYGYVCGERGALLFTNNAGTDWKIYDLNTKSDLNTLEATSNNLFIGTSNGEVLKVVLN